MELPGQHAERPVQEGNIYHWHDPVAMPASYTWDVSLNEFVDFGTPEASTRDPAIHLGVRAGFDEQHAPHDLQNLQSGINTQSANDVDSWPMPSGFPSNGTSTPNRKTSENDVDMQRQIDQLREMVAPLISQHHNRRLSTHQPRKNDANIGGEQTAASTANKSRSFSLFQSNGRQSGRSSGYVTPVDQLASPFDFSDDSPIYSRRGSASSIGSLSAKRGQRITGGYRCGKCQARFDVPSALKHHERNHLSKEERPHPCSRCGDRFLYPKDVLRHERQVHNLGKPDSELPPGSSSPVPNPPREDNQLSPKDRRQRRRHSQLSHKTAGRAREKRSGYVRHLQAAGRQKDELLSGLQSRSGTPVDRRDSSIPDIITEDVDQHKSSLILSNTGSPLEDRAGKLQTQVEAQQRTINDLERTLRKSTEDAERCQVELDAFAKILRQVFVSSEYLSPPWPQHIPYDPAPPPTQRAKEWLQAIELLLLTAENQDQTQTSQTSLAVQHLSLALDRLTVSDAGG